MLGDDADVNRIESELKLFISYGVDLQEAKRGVLKKLGNIQIRNLSSPGVDKALEDLEEGDNNVNIKVKVISIDTKMVTVEGEEKEIYYGILADESSSIPFTAWNDFGLEKDAVVLISGAYVRSFRSELQINIGNNATVETLQSEDLIGLTPEKIAEFAQVKKVPIGHLKAGMPNFSITGRILGVESKEVIARGEPKIVFSGVIGDSTGKVQFSAWHDFNLKPDSIIKVSNCYVKNWRGIPQLTFDENSTVEFLEDSTIPSSDIIEQGIERKIIDLEEYGGGFDIIVSGVILEFRKGSGIIKRCPSCRRVMIDEQCQVHGPQPDGLLDIRVKAIIDDGTGSIMAVIGGEISESLLGITGDEYRSKADEPGYTDYILGLFEQKILIERFRLRGNVTKDNFGLMMIVTELSPFSLEVEKEAEKLLEQMEAF